MATSPKKTQKEVTKTAAAPVAERPEPKAQPLVATASAAMFESDAGSGMEGTDSESFAIPFLMVLQKGSPQVDEAAGEAIEGAKAGMLFENVTSRMFDGKVGVNIVPCAYRRVFLRWGPRDGGGGFKGELLPEQVVAMRQDGKIVEVDGRLYIPLEDGSVHEKKCDRIADTRNHFVLILNDDGSWTNALLSLTSTQIKKSKMLMSALSGVKVNGSSGPFTPPTFANVVHVTTVPESNDKGAWYGVRFEVTGPVADKNVYAAGRAFHGSVAKGAVAAKYEEAPSADAGSTNGF